jgi:PHP family Zn ribbon phosphoesterase
MQCPKCKTENSETLTFCLRCHTPLKYTCPSCKHVQLKGGTCEKCGVDFAKYAAMLIFQAKDTAQAERTKAKGRNAILKQIILLPITGGLSLIKYFVGRARGG